MKTYDEHGQFVEGGVGMFVCRADAQAEKESLFNEGVRLAAELDKARKQIAALTKTIDLLMTERELDKQAIFTKDKVIATLTAQLAEVTKNRDELSEVVNIDRLHSTGGANGKRWEDCECPSCFLHMDYKAKLKAREAALKEIKLLHHPDTDAHRIADKALKEADR